jgi:hypothetical protein
MTAVIEPERCPRVGRSLAARKGSGTEAGGRERGVVQILGPWPLLSVDHISQRFRSQASVDNWK